MSNKLMKQKFNDELNTPIEGVHIQNVIDKFYNTSLSFKFLKDSLSDYDICYDNQCLESYIKDDKIVICGTNNLKNIELDIVRMYRQAWHIKNKSYYDFKNYQPDQAIILARTYFVDGLAFYIKTILEYSISCNSYEYKSYSKDSPIYNMDVIIQFCLEMIREDFTINNSGLLMRYLYNNLFDERIIHNCDDRTIKTLLNSQIYLFGDKLEKVPLVDFYKIGDMPIGKNYFLYKPKDKNIQVIQPNDQRYATIYDRRLSNYLWFLKFEFSYNKQNELQHNNENSQQNNIIVVDFAKK